MNKTESIKTKNKLDRIVFYGPFLAGELIVELIAVNPLIFIISYQDEIISGILHGKIAVPSNIIDKNEIVNYVLHKVELQWIKLTANETDNRIIH